MSVQGSYTAKRKDGSTYFRSSITYKNRHISLGSFDTDKEAGAAYLLAEKILTGQEVYLPEDYEKTGRKVSFDKWIMLINLKKTGIYCKNPIYMYGKFFVYFLNRETGLKFDVDDLFFFRTHRIQQRGGHLFYSDFGMQCSLLNRYGVRSFAVKDRDYYFKNGDENDYSYGNIVIVNKYNGVQSETFRGKKVFTVRLHMKGNVTVGRYDSETEAAIAYNKAADSIEEHIRAKENENITDSIHKSPYIQDVVFDNSRMNKQNTIIPTNTDDYYVSDDKNTRYKKWQRNYVENITNPEYISIYMNIKFCKGFRKYLKEL